jgi:glucosylceramidase
MLRLNNCPQTIEGFGGAFTEASAYNYMKLSAVDRARVMELYFGCKAGNKYNMGRIPMK